MTDTRLTADEVALLRDRLPVGYHISEDLLRKAAAEYLRVTKAGVPQRHVRLHYHMTILRDWLTQRLQAWPREDQDDIDADNLHRLHVIAAAWGADRDVACTIIALVASSRDEQGD